MILIGWLNCFHSKMEINTSLIRSDSLKKVLVLEKSSSPQSPILSLLDAIRARKKSRPGRVDFFAGQVTVKAYLLNAWAGARASHPVKISLTKTSKKWPRANKI